MDTTPARIHPKKILVSKLSFYGSVNNLHSGGYERPTAFTDIGTRTTRPDRVIVRHIDIKHEFPLYRIEGAWANCFFVPWLQESR